MMRKRREGCSGIAVVLVLGTVLVVAGAASARSAAQQLAADVPPDATPQVVAVRPSQGAPGQEVAVVIEGKNFSPGVYVSFSDPTVHAVSTRRVSPTELEARIAIGAKAPFGTIILYVSNPGSTVAKSPFTVTASSGAPPEEQTVPAATGPPTSVPAQTEAPAAGLAPEVTSIEPPRAAPGSQTMLKISGKNFARGVKVAFSNPGIRVLDVESNKDSEIQTRIQVAADAPTGTTGMFIVNPDDNETEVTFEVSTEPATAATPASTPTGQTTPATAPQTASKTTSATGGGDTLQFEVISLSDVTSVLESRSKPKGTLSLAAGRLRYEESGREVFSAPKSEIKEVGANFILGVNTGTFHIILANGQTYNFIAASFRVADSQSIMESLRAGLK